LQGFFIYTLLIGSGLEYTNEYTNINGRPSLSKSYSDTFQLLLFLSLIGSAMHIGVFTDISLYRLFYYYQKTNMLHFQKIEMHSNR